MCRPIRRVHMSMRTEGIKAFSKRIRRCSVDGRKRYENDKCGRKSFWKRSKKAPFSFENGLVWTGPYYLTLIISCLVTFLTFFAASYHQVRAILVAESSSQDGSFLLGPRALRQSWKKVSRHFWEHSSKRSCNIARTSQLSKRNRRVPYHIDIDPKTQNIMAKERKLYSVLWEYIQKSKFLYSGFNRHVFYKSYQVARETIRVCMLKLKRLYKYLDTP